MMQNDAQRKFGIRDKLGYMFGDFGNDFFFLFASSFLMVFYTKVLGIDPAEVGTLFLIARLVDAFTDITMGRIVDVSRPTKNGKFRPWILRMCVPVVIAGTLLFVPWVAKLSLGWRRVYIYATYLLWGSFCYTAINIPYGSMASAITKDPVERSGLSTFRSIGAALAGIIINSGVPLVIYRYDKAGNQLVIPERFFYLAVLFAAAALICYLLCYGMVRERVTFGNKKDAASRENGTEENRGIGRTLLDLTRNRALIAIIAAAIVLLLATLFTQSMNVYLYMDYFRNNSALSAVGFFGTAVTLLLAPFASSIVKNIGKKEASAAAVLFAAGVYFVLYALRLKNPWMFCLFVAIGSLGSGLFNLLIWAFITDVIDYQEILTGSRSDGTVYALYSFARKLGQALAGGLGGWILAAIGYQSSVAGETIVQTDAVVNAIYSVATLAPGICYLIVGLILLWWYPLGKKKVRENYERLNGDGHI